MTDADVSNAAFPFGHAREIAIAGAPVRALRVTYVGELGWELHMPIAATGEVFDALMAAGAAARASRPPATARSKSLRLEKGYRAWGCDITPNDTPFEAGLGWAVKLEAGLPFIGREALEEGAGAPLRQAARRLHHRGPRSRARRPRDHPARWRICRLSDQRRLWLHGRPAHRLWAMSATRKG